MSPSLHAETEHPAPLRGWRRPWFRVFLALVAIAAAGLLIALEYTLHNAEPILHKRLVETLSARFHAPVTLGRVEISLLEGMKIEGYDLRIPFPSGEPFRSGTPLLVVQHFAFRTTLRGLWRQPMRVSTVTVDGMELHIPPASMRSRLFGSSYDGEDGGVQPKVAILVQQLRCQDVKLYVESGKPDRAPLFFQIRSLALQDIGGRGAMAYDAVLTNPKPAGLIHATGHFGPWAGVVVAGAAHTPVSGETPVDGVYTLDHADLNSIKGIGGTLSSAGQFRGVLNRLLVDGTADVPDFSLDISDHPVPLRTRFHALVDGSNGDTYLEPVHGRLADSDFTTSGQVVHVPGRGHDVLLDIDIPRGRVQDFLRLAVRTTPPLMDATLAMHAHLHIPPGPLRVPLKTEMQGAFQLTGIEFANQNWRSQLNALSARAQGHPEEVSAAGRGSKAETRSTMAARFTLGHGLLSATEVHYALPGVQALLNGVYSMDGKLFEFKGHVRTQATASEMVSGWQSLLLKPVDRFLQRNGAGVDLPVEVSGTGGALRLGLALQGTGDTPAQMLADLQARKHLEQVMRSARELAALADAEDAAAARAPTLEAAERAHAAAVRLRTEAETKARAVRGNGDLPAH